VTEHDPNEVNAAGPDSQDDGRSNGQNTDTNQSVERPYGDAGNLYEIPRIRQDDPPMRRWWIDDEPQQDGSGSDQNG
jgi:hypothetical protein